MRVLVILVLASLLVASACQEGGNSAAPPSRAAGATATAAPGQTAATSTTAPGRFTFTPIGKRDPFRSPFDLGLVADGSGPIGPLQWHEVDQYRVRGIVWTQETPPALIEGPDGIGHVVEIGTLIGKHWGKVTQVGPESLVVTERLRDPIEGLTFDRQVTMRLPVPAEGDSPTN
jgi:type IV pilus assembly protein PilP